MSESLGKRIHGLRGAARLTAIGEIVSGWRASGTGRAAFCREVGIVPVTLGCRWIGRLDAANGDQNVYLSGRNLPTVEVMPYAQASAYDVLWSDAVVVEEGALTGVMPEPLPDEPEAEEAAAPRKRTTTARAKTAKPAKKAAKPAKKAAKKPAKKAAKKPAKKSATKATKKPAPKKKGKK